MKKILISFLLLLCCISASSSSPLSISDGIFTSEASIGRNLLQAKKPCPILLVNDLSNECSSTMFSYINLYGNYPPGLFANLCRDDKIGLICPALAPGTQRNNVADNSNNSPNIHGLSIWTLTVGFLILFMWT
ncbi:hypothetical protein L1987_85320 [Smallanthus sonchifolius]|uniref:Uncharacterized protein n=1 Tax=Smallanthus sonchifolius TaxID=185202 RepID=A0ACB8XW78_9ASTR|nr:hypothetical protein L1987_85320 [Smallanthus sonchifolius]